MIKGENTMCYRNIIAHFGNPYQLTSIIGFATNSSSTLTRKHFIIIISGPWTRWYQFWINWRASLCWIERLPPKKWWVINWRDPPNKHECLSLSWKNTMDHWKDLICLIFCHTCWRESGKPNNLDGLGPPVRTNLSTWWILNWEVTRENQPNQDFNTPWVVPPFQVFFYMFCSGSLKTYICHYYWEWGTTQLIPSRKKGVLGSSVPS